MNTPLVNNVLTAGKAQKILLEDGLEVSIDESQLILDFLRILAKIVVKHYVNNHEKSRSICAGEHG
jgi:hypothetical protein